jgi:hypothetical protein
MNYYAALDVSLRSVHLCMIDDQGELITDTKMFLGTLQPAGVFCGSLPTVMDIPTIPSVALSSG